MTRTPVALIPYLVIAAAVALGLLWQMADRQEGLKPAAIGGEFSLIDQDGHRRHAADFRGRFMLVYFGYSYCPDVCPTTLTMMADALDKLGPLSDRIVPVFITIDPARDTPKVLKDYLKSFGPRFVGLTGDAKAVAAAAKAYRVYYKKQPLKGGGYAMDHSSLIYLMGPDGRFLTDYDESLGADGMAALLKKWL
jgi:protein SCO1/2